MRRHSLSLSLSQIPPRWPGPCKLGAERSGHSSFKGPTVHSLPRPKAARTSLDALGQRPHFSAQKMDGISGTGQTKLSPTRADDPSLHLVPPQIFVCGGLMPSLVEVWRTWSTACSYLYYSASGNNRIRGHRTSLRQTGRPKASGKSSQAHGFRN